MPSGMLRELNAVLGDAHRHLDARSGQLGRTLTAADRSLRDSDALVGSLSGLVDPHSDFRSPGHSHRQVLVADA